MIFHFKKTSGQSIRSKTKGEKFITETHKHETKIVNKKVTKNKITLYNKNIIFLRKFSNMKNKTSEFLTISPDRKKPTPNDPDRHRHRLFEDQPTCRSHSWTGTDQSQTGASLGRSAAGEDCKKLLIASFFN